MTALRVQLRPSLGTKVLLAFLLVASASVLVAAVAHQQI